jgi:hypothetical protein
LKEAILIMGKKKREQVVFDQMLKQKKSIPFSKTISDSPQKQKTKPLKSK